MSKRAGLVRPDGEEAAELEEQKEAAAAAAGEAIMDFTERDLVNLRRTIYLAIVSSVDYEECCHKLLKL